MLEVTVALLVVLCAWFLVRRRQAPPSFPQVRRELSSPLNRSTTWG